MIFDNRDCSSILDLERDISMGVFTYMFGFCWMSEDALLNGGSFEYETAHINCCLDDNVL